MVRLSTVVPFDVERASSPRKLREVKVVPVVSDHSDDIEERVPVPVKDESDESDDDDWRPSDEKLIEPVSQHFRDIIRENWTFKDIILFSLTLTATGLIARDMSFVESRYWINSVINTYSYTEPGFRFVFQNPQSFKTTNKLIKAIEINNYVALPIYFTFRLFELAHYLGTSIPKPLRAPVPQFIKILAMVMVCCAAITSGGSAASQFYGMNWSIDLNRETNRLTPYLFAFYTVDAFLRYAIFKDKELGKFFTKRLDDDASKKQRKALISKIEKTKSVVASMTADELHALRFAPKVAAGNKPDGIDIFQMIVDIGAKDNCSRRFSVKVRHRPVKKPSFSLKALISRYWSICLGLLLAVGGAYLSYEGSKNNFNNGLHVKIPHHIATPDFKALATEYTLKFNDVIYKVWRKDTANVVVYNGNGTDWCSQCRDSARYFEGNMDEGGTFHFYHCPGVIFVGEFTSSPGDWNYTQGHCQAWFDFLDHFYASQAGKATDDDTSSTLTPRHLNIGQQVVAITAAGILASMSALLSAMSSKEAIIRVQDSFSNEPENILPGKRNKVFNVFTLSMGWIQSLIRATTVGTAGWYTLQGVHMRLDYLWMIVGLCVMSSAMTFFNDFDDAYSRVPYAIRKVHSMIVEASLVVLRGESSDRYRHHEVICDEALMKLNDIIGVLETTPKDVVQMLYRNIQ